MRPAAATAELPAPPSVSGAGGFTVPARCGPSKRIKTSPVQTSFPCRASPGRSKVVSVKSAEVRRSEIALHISYFIHWLHNTLIYMVLRIQKRKSQFKNLNLMRTEDED